MTGGDPAPSPEVASPSVPLLTAACVAATARADAVFTTRAGGVSTGAFAALNLSYGVGDAPDAVAENRRRVARAWAARPERLVEAAQVHGRAVAVVRGDAAGTVVPGADALVTDAPDVWLAVYAADCVPLLVVDPDRPAVGALHAGWRGTAAGIVGALLAVMGARFSTRPDRLRTALGPAIGPCCYEVDDPVARAMERQSWWRAVATATRPGYWRLDLRAAIRAQLVDGGVAPDAIEMVGGCTACDRERFFSYRRDRVTGRLAGCIRVRE